VDVLRLTVLAIVACSPAGAEPAAAPADRAHPAGWRQLPAITGAVTAAARADGVTLDAVDAWGEPAVGCYAVWLDLHGRTTDAAALADQVLAGVAGLSPSEIARPTEPDGVLGFGFARPPYRGRVRARLGGGRVSAVACFGNQREPVACDAACTRVLQGAP
jgi:hypothetical protein